MKARIILLLNILFLVPYLLMAQQAAGAEVEMADALRSSGKIYVVVVVIAILMTGLIVYLINLDRKLRKIEKKLTEKKPS